MHLKNLLFGVGLLLLAVSSASWALSQDTKQPIFIDADRGEHDEKQGLTIYQGSVVIVQGSIRIEADTVSIYNEGDRVERIVCQGNLARYEQRPSESEELLIAYAKTIEYVVSEDTITLFTMASLEQDGATITGDKIKYDLKNEVVNAKGDNSSNTRIQMVIPPEALNNRQDETP